ncbi:hypothetical protein QO002_006183 [Pararhizobium capsulatum DSM 1112]|uniref:Uncharacterized protein n=1 Tax=Pararhizobium capsulatum DSM 1112 TaxID=1121113 RepID=A0ABU0C236_9HYPH|nr:hypothetical protein [Pararhizobium capsulatum DSM 1112]
MRHPRSIDLVQDSGTQFDTETIALLPEWYVLEGVCGKCGHVELIGRRQITRRFGEHIRLPEIARKLRCRCGNKGNNILRLGVLPR